ncbi:hypothetical protein BLX87_09860 [Bacillus sp. VT-16-64]|nr:hypothetical protein BLX87_09860 [Bacillus sp. VT-16-64]
MRENIEWRKGGANVALWILKFFLADLKRETYDGYNRKRLGSNTSASSRYFDIIGLSSFSIILIAYR